MEVTDGFDTVSALHHMSSLILPYRFKIPIPRPQFAVVFYQSISLQYLLVDLYRCQGRPIEAQKLILLLTERLPQFAVLPHLTILSENTSLHDSIDLIDCCRNVYSMTSVIEDIGINGAWLVPASINHYPELFI